MHGPLARGDGKLAYKDQESDVTGAPSHTGDLLRFVISGSVDDGKSTLLGRLLYDSERLPEDELAVLAKDSARYGTCGDDIDFALLVDGLSTEREQGITIDVAYRYFATKLRSFIVADTPGHEQYTRNMATGASTADVAVLLVDARNGPTAQTRRHLFIVWMLGIQRVVIAVNKMDLVDYARERFDVVAGQCRDMAMQLDLALDFIPVSATRGDNVVDRSHAMSWYHGPALLRYLETVTLDKDRTQAPLRFPVQWVSRPNAEFRGYGGMIASGSVAPGTKVICYPSGRIATVGQISVGNEPVLSAQAGQSVLLTLTTDIDIARGDVIVANPAAIGLVRSVKAHVLCMADQPLGKGQRFVVKLASNTAMATVVAVDQLINVLDYSGTHAASIDANGVGVATIEFDKPLPLTSYRDCREFGGFILIDRMSNETVALGLVIADAGGQRRVETTLTWAPTTDPWRSFRDRAVARLRRTQERPLRSLFKALTWRTTGGIDTFILAFLFTGSAKISAAISGTELATKLVLYYIHERIWARSKFGLRK